MRAILLACFTAFVSVLAVGYASSIGVFGSILMAALAAAMVAFLASILTSALATHVPFETAGAFARWFVSRHHTLLAEHAGVNEREARDAVCDLVAYHYGTRPEDVGAETRFV
ncbi:MAG TPA: hypothetical protein VM487_05230 [Phycisphaerae bacterium]|nr:hypothetical protein [Phycisphaerae bacterium]